MLKGKTAVITGAGTGIGKETAHVLAGHGANVVVTGYLEPEAAAVAAAVRANGGQAIAMQLDVTNEEQIAAVATKALATFGSIDVLVNNAALTDPEWRAKDRDVCKMDVTTWDRVMAVNLRGPMLTIKHTVPSMIKGGGGVIINITSGMGAWGELTQTAYGVSKAALNSLTRYAATQYGKQRVRCNALQLGSIVTDKSNEERKVIASELSKIFLSNHLTPYMGTARHVAETIAFLASDAGSFITGQVIPVDGGVTAHSPLYAQLQEMFAASGDNKF
jgi:NAD(P)-dependent dehydrogenase (short-subunit alcohol dehydrogenase family)